MTQECLRFEDLKDFLSSLVPQLEAHVPYAAGLGQRRQGLRAQVASAQSQLIPEPSTAGLVLTLFNGRQFYELSHSLAPAALIREKAIALAKRAAQEAASQGPERYQIDPGPKQDSHDETPLAKDPFKAKTEAKLARAQELQALLAAADPRVRNAVAMVSDFSSEEVFVTRTRRLSQRLVRVEEMMQVYVAEGGKSQMLWDGVSRAAGLEALGWCAPRVGALVADACRLLSAPRLEDPGLHEVVADPSWAGMLAHEAFGHGTETDMYLKDRARGAAYMGKQVGSPQATLYDDPSMPGQSGSCFFDHEGCPASPTRILNAGVLERGMTDLNSALALGLPRSANGRRESWERKAYARMTNTYFAPGPHKPAALIAAVEQGYYLRHASNGMEDPQGWGIQCEGLWAERIKGGKLTGEVFSPVILTGYVPDILASISMAADDLTISGLGHCGKGHKEWVKNTLGGPHLKLRARLA
jgi:TldD protein